MRNRIRHLKVKIKSLAAEAVIIRSEERKSNGVLRGSLADHRRGIVRTEARHAQIAYAFLRGRRYEQIEQNPSKPFDRKKVLDAIARFGPCMSGSETYKEWQQRLRDCQEQSKQWVESALMSRA